MIATSPAATSGTPSPFDLPPIASPLPYVSNQSAVPFSQLLLNTPQQAPPSPQPAPPPATPTDKKSATSDQSGTDNQTTGSGSQTPTQTDSSNNAQAGAGPSGNGDSGPANPSPSPDNTPVAQPVNGNATLTQPTATAIHSGTPIKAVGQAATASAAISNRASAATVAAALAKNDRKTKADTTDPSKPASHNSGTEPGTSPAVSTVQVSAQPTLVVPDASTVVANDTFVKGQTGGKTKAAVQGGASASTPAASESGAGPLPQGNARSFLNALTDASATPAADAAAPAQSHTAVAGQAALAKNAATLASPPIQAGNIAAPVLSAATAAMNAMPPGNIAATVVQSVETVTASLPQAASTTTDSTPANAANAAAPAPNVNPTNSPNVPQANPLQATPTFAGSVAANTVASSPSDPLSAADRARFVQRVARAFQSVGDQGGQIRLRLSPPELGSLQMEITVKQGTLTANIQADNSTAQQALLSSLPDLRERLAQQDIRIDHFDVQLAGQSSGGLPQSPQGNSGFDQSGRQFAAARTTSAPAVDAAASETTAIAASATNGALNVVV